MLPSNTKMSNPLIATICIVIGKSTEMNYVLMLLLAKLGDDDWPSTVLFRLPGENVVEFSFEASSRQRIVREFRDTKPLSVACDLSEIYIDKNAVMLIELEEDEMNPRCAIPCYITVPSEDAIEVTKSISKTGRSMYLLSDPPSLAQLKLQALALREHSQALRRPRPFLNGSTEEVLATIETRASIVGTLPRHTLCHEEDYIRQRNAVASQATEFFTGIPSLSVFDVPDHAKDYVAPFIKPNMVPWSAARTPDDSPVYEFRFLSDHCARVVAASIEVGDKQRLSYMSHYGLDSQIAAVSMVDTLRKDASDTNTREAWEVYSDPGSATELTEAHRLVKEEDSFKSGVAIPLASRTVLFDGTQYEGDVKLLQENTLYRSSVSHHMAVGECFMVSHHQCKVWLFQSTCRDVKDHPFTLSAVRSVMEKLGMLTGTGLGYEIVVVIFADWSRPVTHGSRLGPTPPDSKTASKKGRAPSESPSPEDQAVVPRLSTLIVRHRYYPKRPKVDLKKK